MLIEEAKKNLLNALQMHLKNPQYNVLSYMELLYQDHYQTEIGTIKGLAVRYNKKIKGDLFESFCYLYFKNFFQPRMKSIWFLQETPTEVLEKLSLNKQDYGIDLIACDDKGSYYAIQVKFRKPNKKQVAAVLGWQQLSTFYALTSRTGPYKKHIVFTNARSINRQGKRNIKDDAICRTRLENLTVNDFYRILNLEGNILSVPQPLKDNVNGYVKDNVNGNGKIKVKVIAKANASDNESDKSISIQKLRELRIKKYSLM